MEEVVAHPYVDHGGLRRDGFHGRVGIDAGHHGQKTGIAGADETRASVVAGDVGQQPGNGVPGVGAFVDGFGGVVAGPMIDQGPAHHKLALALVTAANVLVHVDVAVSGQFRAAPKEGGAVGSVHTVRRALDEEWERGGDVCGFENHGVELDAVAHGNHNLGALVVVKLMLDGRAGAEVVGVRLIGPDHGDGLA